MGIDISINHVCILFQELCFDFFKKLVFTPLRCYGLSVIVYWYLHVRLKPELFASKGLMQVETTVIKKSINFEEMQQKWQQNKNQNLIILYV